MECSFVDHRWSNLQKDIRSLARSRHVDERRDDEHIVDCLERRERVRRKKKCQGSLRIRISSLIDILHDRRLDTFSSILFNDNSQRMCRRREPWLNLQISRWPCASIHRRVRACQTENSIKRSGRKKSSEKMPEESWFFQSETEMTTWSLTSSDDGFLLLLTRCDMKQYNWTLSSYLLNVVNCFIVQCYRVQRERGRKWSNQCADDSTRSHRGSLCHRTKEWSGHAVRIFQLLSPQHHWPFQQSYLNRSIPGVWNPARQRTLPGAHRFAWYIVSSMEFVPGWQIAVESVSFAQFARCSFRADLYLRRRKALFSLSRRLLWAVKVEWRTHQI